MNNTKQKATGSRLTPGIRVVALALLVLFSFASASHADDSVCAQVKIEIKQELTLERQAFDARMRINNGLDTQPLQNIDISVSFKDELGVPILATSDPNNTSAAFFIRVDTMTGVDNITGSGTVAPASSADINWLIIPAPGSGGSVPSGKLYFVGATLKYTLGGEPQTITVTPDTIYVKPLPLLTLDYFLTKDVYADDAFTTEIEPSEPFTLGVRVKNTGGAAAKALKIESAQPRITENNQGLLIGFQIIGSYVNDQSVTNSLLVDLGDIAPNRASAGRWLMTTTLSGKFIDFKASFIHADALGGALTSVLQATNAHFLVRDVKIDLPGRDSLRDFLAQDGDALRLYESEGVDTDVVNQSASATLAPAGGTAAESLYNLSAPATAGLMYVQLPDPNSGTKALTRVTRADGKTLAPENAWLSKARNADNTWRYLVNVFDANSSGSYTVAFAAPAVGPRAPAIQLISDQVVPEGSQVSFIVESSDPDGITPALSATPLATGAVFTDQGTGTGIFDWTPTVGQAGRYPINFTASDGVLTTTRTATITVTPLTPGAPDVPLIQSPAIGTAVSSLQPTLTVAANTNVYDSTSHYQYELYRDASLTQLVIASPDIPKNINAGTDWKIAQNLLDNTDYYWRVRSSNGVTYSAWTNGRFKVNVFNEPPRAVALSAPVSGATVDSVTPTLVAMNSVDPDGDAVTYDFEVFSDAGLSQRVAYVTGVAAGSTGATAWTVTPALADATLYYWRATAVDAYGLRRPSTAWNFLVDRSNPAPAAPTIAQPLTGSVVAISAVDLVVNNSVVTDGQATTYLFELDAVNTFDSIGRVSSGSVTEQAGTTQFNIATLIENQRYYWRVRASDGVSDSAWVLGDFRVDTVNDAPALPTPKNPGQNAAVTTTTPRLEATAVSDPEGDAVQYRFEVYADAALSARVADVLNVAPEWIVSPQLADSQQYFWRVRAEDSRTGVSAWSATHSFVVNAQTTNRPAITLTSPTTIVEAKGGSYTVTWEIQDAENNSSISLYRDSDGQGADGTVVVADLRQDPATSTGSYVWDVSQLAIGTYYLYAVANNGIATDTRYAPGAIVIPAPQPRGVITVTPPTTAQTTEAGGAATFSVVLGNAPSADVVIDLNSTNSKEGGVTPSALTFTRANWNVAQTVTVTGVSDCAVDGNASYQVVTGNAVSADPNYNGLNAADIDVVNVDAGVTCNVPPSVQVGADQSVNEGGTVALSGNATDSDGTIASYAWTQTAGPSVTLTGANQTNANFTAPSVTTDTVLTFRLTATDNQGATGVADTNVTVRNVNQMPTANAGAAQTVNENATVTVTGSGSDTDGTIASYQWTQVSGPTVVINNANAAEMSFIAPQVTANTALTFQLTVTDNDGGTANATTSITVVNVNQLPTANAGAAQAVNENVQVSLVGSGSDADGTIASYAWTQTAGPTVTIVNPTSANASFVAPQVGADTPVTLQLTVTDNEGAAGVASVIITVRNVNQAPTANAGVDQTVGEGASVTLTGSASDPDGSIASYAWTQTAGPAVTLVNPNTAQAGFVAPEVTANTVFTFQLSVVDNEGATATATASITVVSINKLPAANAGSDQNVNEDAGVTLVGSGSDVDGSVVAYAWTQTAGPAVTLTGANSSSATFTAPQVSAETALTFQLTVTDNQGGTATDTVSIAVTNIAQDSNAPIARITADPTSGGYPLTVRFDGSASTDAEGPIVSYSWDFGDGYSANGSIATHTYAAAGVYNARLSVTDGASNFASTSVAITVAGETAPIARIDASPTTGDAPLTVAFDARSSSDAQGAIASYKWDFGDGSSGSGATVNHTYQSPGTYDARLTVADSAGLTHSSAQTITVTGVSPETTTYQQNYTAIAYGPSQGSWSTGNDANASGGSYVVSGNAGARLTFTFMGTGIKWLSVLDSCSGQANVTLDGTTTRVDNYRSPTQGWQKVAWERAGLTNTTHTLTIEVLGTANAASCGPWVYVDAFHVTTSSVATNSLIENTDDIVVYGPSQYSWSNGANASASGGSYAVSDSAGATMSFSFEGTGIKWISVLDGCSGHARVTLDGASVVVDNYRSPTQGWRKVAWERSGLSNSTHSLTIEVLGTKNAASCGPWVYVDAFEVTRAPQAPSPTRIENDATVIAYGPEVWSWNSGTDANASGGTYVVGENAGAALSFNFTGTGIRWISVLDGCSGQARVTLDGVTTTVDNYRDPTQGWQKVAWEATGLTNANHTVRIEVLGTANPASCGPWVYVDAFDILP